MAVWAALLLGMLGGTAMFANSLALHNEDGALGHWRRGQGRPSFRDSNGNNGASPLRLEISKNHDHPTATAGAVLPRVLTVLTTYDKRSAWIKEYKEAVFDREDGYAPEVRVLVFQQLVWNENMYRQMIRRRRVISGFAYRFRAFAGRVYRLSIGTHPAFFIAPTCISSTVHLSDDFGHNNTTVPACRFHVANGT